MLKPCPRQRKDQFMGTAYKRGKVWWIKYYRDGKPYRESAHSKKKSDADKLLKLREGSIVQGTFQGLQVERTMVNELLDDIIAEYSLMERKSCERLRYSTEHLRDFFGNLKACKVTTTHVQQYIFDRQKAGMKNGTINRELSALRRAFTLGFRHTPPKVTMMPHIPKLKETNVRTGFFEYDEYVNLRDALPSYLKPLLIAAYYTGMRRGELLDLQWHQVDIWNHRIILEPGSTKNGEGRVVYMFGELFDVLLAQKKIRDARFPECQNVFFFHHNGQPFNKDFRTAWEKALIKVKLEGRLFHDLRRTAVRNMVRAGVPEVVAMRISGHKTRAVFDRYNITSEDDIRLACERLSTMYQENAETLSRAQDGHNLGTLSVIRGFKR